MDNHDVVDLLRALRDGTMTLEDVAKEFRSRKWPPLRQSAVEHWTTATLRDPEPRIPDSFDDVVAAYDRGEITNQQFQVLADAVADAIGRKSNQRE